MERGKMERSNPMKKGEGRSDGRPDEEAGSLI
jgi:hypothetical protein